MTDVERYLYRYNHLERKKRILESELKEATEEYRAQQESLLAPAKTSEVKTSKTNRISDPVPAAVIKIVDVYRKRVDRIADDLQTVSGEQQRILDVVTCAGLTVCEENYIRYRYFRGLSACATARKIGYSERWAQRHKALALYKISLALQKGLVIQT